MRKWKKVIVLALLLSFCGGEVQVTEEPQVKETTTTSTTTTSTTTTTTIPLIQKIYASELQVGDCFNNNGDSGYYLETNALIELVPCDTSHQFEVVSFIKYVASEETSFNDDGIPNLEIYTGCEESYEARFGRNIGGTSTYLSWSGDTSNFSVGNDYLCFVAIFDFINGPQEISIKYQDYFNEKTKNFTSKTISELQVGECFWKRRPDVELFYSTEVDVLPCDEVHSHEVVGLYDFPDDLEFATELDYDMWSFKTCTDLGAVMRTTPFFFDELDDFGVRTYSLFDEAAYQVGDQTKAVCLSHVHYGIKPSDDVWHKNISLTETYQQRIVNNKHDFESTENASFVRLSCPTQNEVDDDSYMAGFIFTIVIEERPVQSIVFSYIDNEEEYSVDFTKSYSLHGFEKLPVSIIVNEAWYFYFRSDRSYEDIMELNKGENFLESATLNILDAKGESFQASCEY